MQHSFDFEEQQFSHVVRRSDLHNQQNAAENNEIFARKKREKNGARTHIYIDRKQYVHTRQNICRTALTDELLDQSI